MGKCYCDYCDVFLTNDSVAVRKQHNDGNRHKYNVCEYYRQYVGQKLQQQIDDLVARFESDVASGLVHPTYGLPPPPVKAVKDDPPSDPPSDPNHPKDDLDASPPKPLLSELEPDREPDPGPDPGPDLDPNPAPVPVADSAPNVADAGAVQNVVAPVRVLHMLKSELPPLQPPVQSELHNATTPPNSDAADPSAMSPAANIAESQPTSMEPDTAAVP